MTNPDDTPLLDDRFTQLLVNCDDSLAPGATSKHPPDPVELDLAALPPDWQGRLERNLACIRLLREVLPRHRPNPALTPGVQLDLSGSPPAAGTPGTALTHLGRFEIRRRLGKGAFGVVWLAFDPRLRREVALKVQQGGLFADAEMRARFLREGRAAAALDHPGIVPVFEAGEEGPLCYIASAYCPGPTLAVWLRRNPAPVPIDAASAMLAAVADAVQHAHERNVLHRDLKPANILLQSDESPRVADFGLAKMLGAVETIESGAGTVLGTPNYMAPEQTVGRPEALGPATDIYSLGAILYEMLTGRPPFQAETVLATLNQVCERQPIPPVRIRPGLPAEIEAICLKCLEKEPQRRYATAADLAADLRRFARRPAAVRPSAVSAPTSRWKKTLGRSIVAALLAVALAIVGYFLAPGIVRIVTRASQVDDATDDSASLLDRLDAASIPPAELAAASLDAGGAAPPELVAILGDSRLKHWNEVFCVDFSPNGKVLASGGMDGFIKWWDPATGKLLRSIAAHRDGVNGLAFSPDGSILASAGRIRSVRLWAVPDGRELGALGDTQNPVEVHCVAFAANGKTLASGSANGTVSLWDVASRKQKAILSGHHGAVHSLAFRKADSLLASGGADGTVRLWDTTTGQELHNFHEHHGRVYGVAFSPDGRTVASCGDGDQGLRLWNVSSGRETMALDHHGEEVMAVGFSPDGRFIAGANENMTVRLYDAVTGLELAAPLNAVGGRIRHLAFSPDSRLLATAGSDNSVRIWDLATSSDRWGWPGHQASVSSVAFHPDGKLLASSSWDGMVHTWEMGTGKERLSLHGKAMISCAVFAPDGNQLASAGSGTVTLWDTETGAVRRIIPAHEDSVKWLAFSPDSQTLASASADQTLRLWDVESGRCLRTLEGHRGPVHSVAFSPDGKALASGGEDGNVVLWQLATGEARTLSGHQGPVPAVAFSPTGVTLASGGADSTVRLWNTVTGKETGIIPGHEWVQAVAFRPDAHVLAFCGVGMIRLWDLESSTELPGIRITSALGQTWHLAFSPDGRYLVTANGNGTLYVLRLRPPPGATAR